MKYSRYIYAFLCIAGFAIFLNILAWILNTRLDNEPVVQDTFVSYNKVTMKRSDAESVLSMINTEGFDHTFNHLTTFRDIGDHKFHELRKAYIAASKDLMGYVAEAAGKAHNVPYYMAYESGN